MKCEDCNIEMVEVNDIKGNCSVHALIGVMDIPLDRIIVHGCPECEVESVSIYQVRELHKDIFIHLMRKKGPLLNEELRFIAKYNMRHET